MLYRSLNPTKALIWRIVHRDNLPWILDNGLHCASSPIQAPSYVSIGNGELIDKRRHRTVHIAPGGTLGDYVPFYFTPFSVMMKNIQTGRSVKKRSNEEILILVSSLHRIHDLGLKFIFTNAHAYSAWTEYYDDLEHLDKIDWLLLQRRDFQRDPDDPKKMERYQAEALIHRHLPVYALLGVVCYSDAVRQAAEAQITARGIELTAHTRSEWYFT